MYKLQADLGTDTSCHKIKSLTIWVQEHFRKTTFYVIKQPLGELYDIFSYVLHKLYIMWKGL